MKSEGIESVPNKGLKISPATYNRVKAFHGGGDYWDSQSLIRDSLGEFLPEVEQLLEDNQRIGIFRKTVHDQEILSRSKPLGSIRLPAEQVRGLQTALQAFKRKAEDPETTPHAKDIILHFRLPDISKDPELYRVYGPWWNPKLQILWGCERATDSSLPPTAAVEKLRVDKSFGLKRWGAIVALICLIIAVLLLLASAVSMGKRVMAKAFNKAPVAALKLDSLDEQLLSATISDAGSKDPEGHMAMWRIDWGDGQIQEFSEEPKAVSHAYTQERDYTISLSCFDNQGSVSSPPASVQASFQNKKGQMLFAKAQGAADDIRQKAKDEVDPRKAEAELATDRAEKAELAAKEAEHDTKEAAAPEKGEEAGKENKNEPAQKEPPPEASVPSVSNPNHADDAPKTAQSESPRIEPEVSPGKLSPKPPQPEKESASDTPEAIPDKGRTFTDSRKGAQALNEPRFEIVKAGAGKLLKNGNIQVMLVVRDKSFPNASLQVQEWQVNSQKFATKNTQLTVDLAAGEHIVRVLVKRSVSDPRWQNARVNVTTDVRQTTEADFTVVNF